MSEVRVFVDRLVCMSYGTCVQVAPDHFELGDDGISVAQREMLEGGETSDLELVRRAVQCCPSGAISINDEVTEAP